MATTALYPPNPVWGSEHEPQNGGRGRDVGGANLSPRGGPCPPRQNHSRRARERSERAKVGNADRPSEARRRSPEGRGVCTGVGIRTPNLLIRSQVLYPIELRPHVREGRYRRRPVAQSDPPGVGGSTPHFGTPGHRSGSTIRASDQRVTRGAHGLPNASRHVDSVASQTPATGRPRASPARRRFVRAGLRFSGARHGGSASRGPIARVPFARLRESTKCPTNGGSQAMDLCRRCNEHHAEWVGRSAQVGRFGGRKGSTKVQPRGRVVADASKHKCLRSPLFRQSRRPLSRVPFGVRVSA